MPIPITSLPAAGAITDPNEVPIVQGGATFSATGLQIKDYANGMRAIYADIAARDADVANLTDASIVEVTDASADPAIGLAITAWYSYTGIGTTIVLISFVSNTVVASPVIPSPLGIDYSGSTGVIRPVKVPLGGWNMDAVASITIAHGLTATQLDTLIVIGVTITNDANTSWYSLNRVDASGNIAGGIVEIDGTNITIGRVTAGFFDSTNFNDPIMLRGIIKYEYDPTA